VRERRRRVPDGNRRGLRAGAPGRRGAPALGVREAPPVPPRLDPLCGPVPARRWGAILGRRSASGFGSLEHRGSRSERGIRVVGPVPTPGMGRRRRNSRHVGALGEIEAGRATPRASISSATLDRVDRPRRGRYEGPRDRHGPEHSRRRGPSTLPDRRSPRLRRQPARAAAGAGRTIEYGRRGVRAHVPLRGGPPSSQRPGDRGRSRSLQNSRDRHPVMRPRTIASGPCETPFEFVAKDASVSARYFNAMPSSAILPVPLALRGRSCACGGPTATFFARRPRG
jgi:hypothetical protein